ncbi:MAG: VWA domain-containing protein [Phycisphaerae bacterium]
MQRLSERRARPTRRRGAVAVLTAVTLVVLLGFAALTVDVGMLYNSRADLQQAADAAALAAAARLSDYSSGDPLPAARQAAVEYVERNPVMNHGITIDPLTDVTFGRAVYNATTGSYDFEPTNELPDAVQVRVRMTEDSPNGGVPLLFAKIFGKQTTDMAAGATAIMVPRDITIVADLSGSINDDSELQHYDIADINLINVWDALPIPIGYDGVGDGVHPAPQGDSSVPDEMPYDGPGQPGQGGPFGDPGAAPDGNGQAGPTFGWLYYWGNEITPNYEPQEDPGLIRLPRYHDWNNQNLTSWYQNVGYSDAEIHALTHKQYDGARDSTGQYGWTNRVAVALGLARWDSGMSGGLADSLPPGEPTNSGNGNNWVGANELTWLVDYPFAQGSWSDYIYNYVRRSSTRMAQANPNFRYQFGQKTFINYLLERKPRNDQTAELALTPAQPLQAIKDAVGFMVDFVGGLSSDDRLSLEVYATTAHHEVDLTHDHAAVVDRLNNMQAAHYDGWTNMGGGLEQGIAELTGPRLRQSATKMVILLTDGNANVDDEGHINDLEGGAAYALSQAYAAADAGIHVFAVSVGADANQALMQQIADVASGEHFHAEGSVEEYSAQLAEIFQTLAGTRPVELIR